MSVSDDDDEIMPPPGSNKTLTDAQKALLRQWIEQGAKYQKHWALEPIQRLAVPQVDGAAHPIDAFLAARWQRAGLTAQPQADRETLIRRVALALTGLPPTVTEVDQYLADEASDAYERMVDRYLASPHYGEEMACHWLDVARYADTHGLHLDNERQMWAYRDWVVKALNDNLPFDQFTVWQVAGDLLPSPTTEQLVASGFNRCNVTTSEGGAIDAEFTYRYAVERTSTLAQTWLGLTAGCAVCHDHKYDPLTMKEFYSLYAFFNSAADPAMDGNINTTPPFMKLPTPTQQASAAAAAAVEREAYQGLLSLAALAGYREPADSTAAAPKPVVEILFDDAFPPGSITRSSSRNAIAWVVDPPWGAASGRRDSSGPCRGLQRHDRVQAAAARGAAGRSVGVPGARRAVGCASIDHTDRPGTQGGAVVAGRRRIGPRRFHGVGDRAGTVDTVDGLRCRLRSPARRSPRRRDARPAGRSGGLG